MTNSAPQDLGQMLAEHKGNLTLTVCRSAPSAKHVLTKIAAAHLEHGKMTADIAEPNPAFECRGQLFDDIRLPVGDGI